MYFRRKTSAGRAYLQIVESCVSDDGGQIYKHPPPGVDHAV